MRIMGERMHRRAMAFCGVQVRFSWVQCTLTHWRTNPPSLKLSFITIKYFICNKAITTVKRNASSRGHRRRRRATKPALLQLLRAHIECVCYSVNMLGSSAHLYRFLIRIIAINSLLKFLAQLSHWKYFVV